MSGTVVPSVASGVSRYLGASLNMEVSIRLERSDAMCNVRCAMQFAITLIVIRGTGPE
jgi:hypothetical protein